MARNLFKKNDFYEIYIKASLDTAEKRDPKGLYKKARSGMLPNFTGIDSLYETPLKPDLILDTENQSVDNCSQKLVDFILRENNLNY